MTDVSAFTTCSSLVLKFSLTSEIKQKVEKAESCQLILEVFTSSLSELRLKSWAAKSDFSDWKQ